MATQDKYSLWPCPYCASFTLVEDSVMNCDTCKESVRRSQYKITTDYAAFVYRYGHLFRSVYENQLAQEGKLTPVRVDPAHPIAIAATAVIVSALHAPTVNWFLIKQAVQKFTASYKDVYGDECVIAEEELRAMNKNIREFTLDFNESSATLRNAVFEEIFAEHCSKKEHEKLLIMQTKIRSAKEEDKKALSDEFEKLLQNAMAKTFKKVGQLPKPEPTELATYWNKVLEN